MTTSINDFRRKEVVNIRDGSRLGCVCDVELDLACAKLVSIIIFGRLRFFGLLGREDDICIGWDKIKVIGDDTILVDFDCRPPHRRKGINIFEN